MSGMNFNHQIKRYGITGWGAVSPAGWTAVELHDLVMNQKKLPIVTQQRDGGAPKVTVYETPPMPGIQNWMKFARMRRTTVTARHALHAAVEALGMERLAKVQQGDLKVGVIFCTMNGCVQFSRKFYAEVLHEPSLASPILFPETVYNAPSSHISALLGSAEINYTLVGDSAVFVSAMKMGTQWLEDGLVNGVLVVAAEERDWLLDEALQLISKNAVTAEGAAAVFLQQKNSAETESSGSSERWIELSHVTEAWTYGNRLSPEQATRNVREELLSAEDFHADKTSATLLCDGLGKVARGLERAEASVWRDWNQSRVSIRPWLGESFAVSSGWQTVLACEALARGAHESALVVATGLVQQAVGAKLSVARKELS